MTRFLASAFAILLLFSQSSVAQEKAVAPAKTMPAKTMPVETMHQIDSLDKALDAAKELELLVDRMSRQKYSDCTAIAYAFVVNPQKKPFTVSTI